MAARTRESEKDVPEQQELSQAIPASIQQMSPKFALFLHDILVNNKIGLPDALPTRKDRGMTPEEVFGFLVSFNKHDEWMTTSIPWQPPPGSVFMFNRQKLNNYRKDGYNWMRKKGATNTTRIDRLTLKVFGHDIIHATYCKHEREGRFRRRTYWINENRSIILVQYFLEQKFTLLPPLSDSQWKELLTRPVDRTTEENVGDVSSPLVAPDKDKRSSSVYDPSPSSNSLLSIINQKKRNVPIAPTPQWNLSIIVLKGGNAMIVAYPTSGSGQIVPLGRIALGSSSQQAMSQSSLKDTVMKMLSTDQIPPSAKQLLLQSLLTLAPHSAEDGSTQSPSSSLHLPLATSLLQQLMRSDVTGGGRPHPQSSDLTSTNCEVGDPHSLWNGTTSGSQPASLSTTIGSSLDFKHITDSGLANLPELLQLIKTNPMVSNMQLLREMPPSNLTSNSSSRDDTLDYDAQAFSHFARRLSCSSMDPLNPTIHQSHNKGKYNRREAKRTHQRSPSCPVSPLATRKLSIQNPPVFTLPPSPALSSPISCDLTSLPWSVAPPPHISSVLANPPPGGREEPSSQGSTVEQFTLDGFLEEMDWSNLDMPCTVPDSNIGSQPQQCTGNSEPMVLEMGPGAMYNDVNGDTTTSTAVLSTGQTPSPGLPSTGQTPLSGLPSTGQTSSPRVPSTGQTSSPGVPSTGQTSLPGVPSTGQTSSPGPVASTDMTGLFVPVMSSSEGMAVPDTSSSKGLSRHSESEDGHVSRQVSGEDISVDEILDILGVTSSDQSYFSPELSFPPNSEITCRNGNGNKRSNSYPLEATWSTSHSDGDVSCNTEGNPPVKDPVPLFSPQGNNSVFLDTAEVYQEGLFQPDLGMQSGHQVSPGMQSGNQVSPGTQSGNQVSPGTQSSNQVSLGMQSSNQVSPGTQITNPTSPGRHGSEAEYFDLSTFLQSNEDRGIPLSGWMSSPTVTSANTSSQVGHGGIAQSTHGGMTPHTHSRNTQPTNGGMTPPTHSRNTQPTHGGMTPPTHSGMNVNNETKLTCKSSVAELRTSLVQKLQSLYSDPALKEDFLMLYQLCSSEEVNFETTVIRIWRKLFSLLMERSEGHQEYNPPRHSQTRPTLIHLAAGLGMTSFLEVLKKLSENVFQIEEFFSLEFDPLSTDDDHCTAFFWACFRGHVTSVYFLLHWVPTLVTLPDKYGTLPLEAATQQGHTSLVDHILSIGEPSSNRHHPTPLIEVTSSEGTKHLPPFTDVIPPSSSTMPPPSLPLEGTSSRLSSSNLLEDAFLRASSASRHRDSGIHFDLSQGLLSLTPSPPSRKSTSPLSPSYQFIPGYSNPISPAESSSSSHTNSTLSLQETQHFLESVDSPSVIELCELLSESRNVQENDFASMDLSDHEHLELIRAARTIQSAFRKFSREKAKEKRAALTIESYYKRYREMKRQNHAARVIQQHYRLYKQSLLQDKRHEVERATRVMEELCRLRENEAARKIQRFIRQYKTRHHRLSTK